MLKLEIPNAFRASTGVSPLKPQGVLVFSWVRDQSNLYFGSTTLSGRTPEESDLAAWGT